MTREKLVQQLRTLAIAAARAGSVYVGDSIGMVAQELQSASLSRFETTRKDMVRILREDVSEVTMSKRALSFVEAAIALLEQPRDAVQRAEEELAEQKLRYLIECRLRERRRFGDD